MAGRATLTAEESTAAIVEARIALTRASRLAVVLAGGCARAGPADT